MRERGGERACMGVRAVTSVVLRKSAGSVRKRARFPCARLRAFARVCARVRKVGQEAR